jgi:hypothetical protein
MSQFNFLKQYCRLLEKTEVPPRFTIWTGIAALLATLETRVWINQGIYVIRPNFFMVLVAASGLKKSTAVNLPARLLSAMDPKPRIISQKITPEALITALKDLTIAKDKNAPVKAKCGGIVIADELATFLDRSSLDRGLGPMLTTLFDCGPFEYTTVARGVERLENSYLSLLGGTTVELLRNSLPKDAIGGGFTSRTLFVYEDVKPPPVPWVDHDPELAELELKLIAYLQEVMKLEGPVTVTPAARAFYESDYRHRYANIGEQNGLAQYENRRHAHLFKTAMALMVAESPQLVLDVEHIQTAKVLLEEVEQDLPRVMELLVASETGHSQNLVAQYIEKRGKCLRADLVRQFSMQYNSFEISQIIDTLVKGGMVSIDTNSNGKVEYTHVRGTK